MLLFELQALLTVSKALQILECIFVINSTFGAVRLSRKTFKSSGTTLPITMHKKLRERFHKAPLLKRDKYYLIYLIA